MPRPFIGDTVIWDNQKCTVIGEKGVKVIMVCTHFNINMLDT